MATYQPLPANYASLNSVQKGNAYLAAAQASGLTADQYATASGVKYASYSTPAPLPSGYTVPTPATAPAAVPGSGPVQPTTTTTPVASPTSSTPATTATSAVAGTTTASSAGTATPTPAPGTSVAASGSTAATTGPLSAPFLTSSAAAASPAATSSIPLTPSSFLSASGVRDHLMNWMAGNSVLSFNPGVITLTSMNVNLGGTIPPGSLLYVAVEDGNGNVLGDNSSAMPVAVPFQTAALSVPNVSVTATYTVVVMLAIPEPFGSYYHLPIGTDQQTGQTLFNGGYAFTGNVPPVLTGAFVLADAFDVNGKEKIGSVFVLAIFVTDGDQEIVTYSGTILQGATPITLPTVVLDPNQTYIVSLDIAGLGTQTDTDVDPTKLAVPGGVSVTIQPLPPPPTTTTSASPATAGG